MDQQQQQNNSGGGGNGTLTAVLLLGVAVMGGYLVYQAGKKTAANQAGGSLSGGSSAVYPGTTIPVTHPTTNKTTGDATNGTVQGVTGLLNSIIGLFGKNKSKPASTTSQTGGGSGGYGGSSSGSGGSGTGTGSGGEMTGNLVDNNWDDMGGYMYQFPDGTQDYYYSNDSYAGSSDKYGNWVPAPGGVGSGHTDTVQENGATCNLVNNNWDDANSYMYQCPDGTQDYYRENGVYAGSSNKQGDWVPAP